MSSSSQIIARNLSQIERAWHVLTILIRLGRPASPSELASRSALDSIFLSRDLIEFLCLVPGSPISLSQHRFVTASQVAVEALSEFLNRSCSKTVPRLFGVRLSELRRDLRLMHSRKRKARPLEAGLGGPTAKRRVFSGSERNVEELGTQKLPPKALKVHTDVADTLVNSLSVGVLSNVSNQGAALTLSTPNVSCLSSTTEIKDGGNITKDVESERTCDNSRKLILAKEFDDDSQPLVMQKELHDNGQTISNSENVGRVEAREPEARSALLDKEEDTTLIQMETLEENSCLVPAAPLSVRYEVNPVLPVFPKAVNDSNEPSIGVDSLIHKISMNAENEITAEFRICDTKSVPFLTDASRREQDKSAVRNASKLECTGSSFSAEPKIMNGSASNIGFQKSQYGSNTKKNNHSPKRDKDKRNEKDDVIKQKMRSQILNTSSKENRPETTTKIPKINPESKLLPNFESFVIEEEEGSGGYGTVYKARRKKDGKIFAVKYPHPNANSHHVHNEMKMLERFGGHNFVIKYEGSFKSGQSECFVLEHVEHDRPEVLKKEIDVFELQWYGYCMFRALTSLHKQGIVHRDVKPGNFLFSRKLNKGYLIDFNLANDLHQFFYKSSRAGSTSRLNSDPTSLVTINKEVGNDSRKILLKNMKKISNKGHIEYFPKIDNNNKCGSQAADSGVTSAKEPTSTRTHSADRLKHLIPYKGRKELINFVQEAMQSPTHKEVIGPVSQRKRIAAPLGNMNRRLMILTPMPLHYGGNAVAGAGGTTKGNGKHKREGPCVGTKGFRAPEVLLKSFHQGFKVDIWSAGVTLLYLIIGKSPFGGDPEQNIKEIAKLRGSEDLWEVAKLHDCESSYPSDLFDVQYIRSMKLRDWCRANTKRPEFLELVPQPMFDLIDKCLTVNPRCRITADEALMHIFFTPCHESLRKQRLLRRTGSDSTSGIQPLPSVTSSNDIETSIGLIAQ